MIGTYQTEYSKSISSFKLRLVRKLKTRSCKWLTGRLNTFIARALISLFTFMVECDRLDSIQCDSENQLNHKFMNSILWTRHSVCFQSSNQMLFFFHLRFGFESVFSNLVAWCSHFFSLYSQQDARYFYAPVLSNLCKWPVYSNDRKFNFALIFIFYDRFDFHISFLDVFMFRPFWLCWQLRVARFWNVLPFYHQAEMSGFLELWTSQ